jgi:Uma2 family endonuclease
MSQATAHHTLTLDEFLDWEERQEERYEFVDGQIYLMAGGTEDHDRLANNMIAALHAKLRGTACSVHGSNLKLVARRAGMSAYPDLYVRCGERSGTRTRLEEALIVFEVLSESTAKRDLTRKRRAYQTMPGLRRIVFVSQDEARADLWARTGNGDWRDEDVVGLDGVLELPEIGVSLALAEIYEETDVARAAADQAAAPPR